MCSTLHAADSRCTGSVTKFMKLFDIFDDHMNMYMKLNQQIESGNKQLKTQRTFHVFVSVLTVKLN